MKFKYKENKMNNDDELKGTTREIVYRIYNTTTLYYKCGSEQHFWYSILDIDWDDVANHLDRYQSNDIYHLTMCTGFLFELSEFLRDDGVPLAAALDEEGYVDVTIRYIVDARTREVVWENTRNLHKWEEEHKSWMSDDDVDLDMCMNAQNGPSAKWVLIRDALMSTPIQ